MASFHFDPSQLPPSVSTESQNQGVKLQETITTARRSGCPGCNRPPAHSAIPTPHSTVPLSGPALGFFLVLRPSCGHGYLLEAASVAHADERHAQLLADAVQLALHLLSQGTGGFIKHWGQNPAGGCGGLRSTHLCGSSSLWLGPDQRLKTALPSRSPALGRPWAKGTEGEASCGKPLAAAGQNPSASYRRIPATALDLSIRGILVPSRMLVPREVHTCHPSARYSWGDGRI